MPQILIDRGERAVLAGLLEDRPRPTRITPEAWRQITHGEKAALDFLELAAIIDAYPELEILDALRWPETRRDRPHPVIVL